VLKIIKFIRTQWHDIKGNAKWWVIITVISSFAAIIRFFGRAPLWQVLAVFAAAFILVAFVFWIIQKCNSSKLEPDEYLKRKAIISTLGTYQEKLNQRFHQIAGMEFWDYANKNQHSFEIKAFDPETQILLEEIEGFLNSEIDGASADFKDTINLQFTPVSQTAGILRPNLPQYAKASGRNNPKL